MLQRSRKYSMHSMDYPVGLYDGLNNISLVDVMNKHCLHESIVNIKSHIGAGVSNFDFHGVSADDIPKKINCLKSGKSPGYDVIQATVFFSNWRTLTSQSVCAGFLTNVSQPVFFTQAWKWLTYLQFLKSLIIYVRTIIDRWIFYLYSVLFESIMAEQLTTYFETNYIESFSIVTTLRQKC